MIYRPEQTRGEGKSENLDSLDAYYKRKQQPKHNQQAGEAQVLRDKDRDCEVANSKWKGEGPQKTNGGREFKETSGSIWDDDAWKDKAQ